MRASSRTSFSPAYFLRCVFSVRVVHGFLADGIEQVAQVDSVIASPSCEQRVAIPECDTKRARNRRGRHRRRLRAEFVHGDEHGRTERECKGQQSDRQHGRREAIKVDRVAMFLHDRVIAGGRHQESQTQQQRRQAHEQFTLVDERLMLEVAFEENSKLHTNNDLSAENENARFIEGSLNFVVQFGHSVYGLLRRMRYKLRARARIAHSPVLH
jgi:hypothetical protein